MRLISVEELETGMILGKSLYEPNGKLLLGAGFRINYDMKNKLMSRSYSHVYIMEEGTEDVVPEDIISDEIKFQAKSKLSSKIAEIERQAKFRDISISKARRLIEEGYLKDINIPISMRTIVDEILKDISAVGAKFAPMVMVKSRDTYFLDHAFNTTVLSILLGKHYRFTKPELKSLALGSFLHDMGKVVLNQISKSGSPGKVASLYKEHPTFGYLLLSNSGVSVTPMETQVVNQHHELQDGSGFPIGLKGSNQPPVKLSVSDKGQIFRLAQICCVTNAFDNLVFNPLEKKQIPQDQAIRKIIIEAGAKYNQHIVQTLLKVVPRYPVGVYIRVLDIVDPHLIGYRGVVAKINEENINRPIIILTKDRFQKKIKPMVIDTSKFRHVDLELVV